VTEIELIASELAGHLHDEVMPRLALSLFRADRALAGEAAGPTDRIADLWVLRSELAQSLERLRCLAAALKQVQKAAQLKAALKASAALGLGEAGPTPTLSFDLSQAAALPPDVIELICRVVREGVANAVRHGRAQNIRVELKREPGRIRLELADDGCGFDRSKLKNLTREGHLGLALLRKAVRARGGRMRVSSRPGEGTRLLVALPLARGQP